MDEAEGRRIFQQLIDGLSYCHDKGVYHRDLKVFTRDVFLISLNNHSSYRFYLIFLLPVDPCSWKTCLLMLREILRFLILVSVLYHRIAG